MRPSVMGLQLAPPSVVFQSPPPTAPKYASRGRPFTPVAAIERPPRSGPMPRHLSVLSRAESSAAAVVAAAGARARVEAVESMELGVKVVVTTSADAASARRVGDWSIGFLLGSRTVYRAAGTRGSHTRFGCRQAGRCWRLLAGCLVGIRALGRRGGAGSGGAPALPPGP